MTAAINIVTHQNEIKRCPPIRIARLRKHRDGKRPCHKNSEALDRVHRILALLKGTQGQLHRDRGNRETAVKAQERVSSRWQERLFSCTPVSRQTCIAAAPSAEEGGR